MAMFQKLVSHGGQLLSLYADKGCHFANGSLALSSYVLRYFTLTDIFPPLPRAVRT